MNYALSGLIFGAIVIGLHFVSGKWPVWEMAVVPLITAVSVGWFTGL